jgi:amidase
MTPLEVGSDFAGSLRIPAHFCGVYSLKPTAQRVSMHGHIPDLPGAVRTDRFMWSIGPLARSLDDLALAVRIIAGPDGHDPDVAPFVWQGLPAPELADVRLALAQTFPGVPVSNAIRDVVTHLATELDRLGARVEEHLPDVDFKEQARLRVELAEMERVVAFPNEVSPPPTLAGYLTGLQRRDATIAHWERFFEEWDALLCPVAMTTAFPHCETGAPILVEGAEVNYWRVIGHCAPFNLTGHPAVVMPAGRDADGLPIGVQLVGRRWGEEHLLAVAQRIDEIL